MTQARFVGALVCVAVLGFAASANAQGAPPAEFSAGWRLLNVPNAFGSESKTFPLGWYADVTGNLNRALAADQRTSTFKRR